MDEDGQLMSTGAMLTMTIGMIAIWGGLAVSIGIAIRHSRAARRR